MNVDKGIPLPKGAMTGFTAFLRTLEVGDSFLTEKRHSNVHEMAKAAGIKVSTRADGSQIRVWRTA